MDYRNSHASKNYGLIYSETYKSGYFSFQWERLEKKILKDIFDEFLSRNPGASYLDFACGTGRILSFAENSFIHTSGVDISEEMLVVAKEVCKKSDLIKLDLTRNFLDKKFDVITSFRFFLHAQDELKNEALRAIKSHLSQDGILIANIHVNSKSPLGWVYVLRNFLYRREAAVVLSANRFCQILKENGFRVEKIIYYSFLPRVGWLFPELYNKFLQSFDTFINNVGFIPKGWAQSYIVVATPISK
jgi:ubiquinone/menaquinone biosynthesis C-methylase UbiE